MGVLLLFQELRAEIVEMNFHINSYCLDSVQATCIVIVALKAMLISGTDVAVLLYVAALRRLKSVGLFLYNSFTMYLVSVPLLFAFSIVPYPTSFLFM